MKGLNLALIRARIERLKGAPARIAAAAAPLIEARLRQDATTRRGNIPAFPPLFPLIPITATPQPAAVLVRAIDWVMKKAIDKGQPDAWRDILGAEAWREFGGGR